MTPKRRLQSPRWSLCLCLLLAIMLVAAACADPGLENGTSGPDAEAYLYMHLRGEPMALDPHIHGFFDASLVNAVKEGLVRKQADGSIEVGHGLASEIDISEDQLTYTFTLRETAWSDGTDFTAEDLRYSWLRAIDPRTGTHHSQHFMVIDGAPAANQTNPQDDSAVDAALEEVAIEVDGDHQLTVTLTEVTPHFLELLTLVSYMPINRALHQEVGDNYGTSPETTASIGPFMLTEWVADSHVTLEANPDYWDAEAVKLEFVRFDFVDDDGTAATLWDTSNGLDTVEFLRGALAREYAELGDLKHTDDAAVQYVLFNVEDPGTSPSLRRALSLSIDRTGLVEEVLMDGSQPATSLTPPSVSGLEGQPFPELVGVELPVEPEADLDELLAAAVEELGVDDVSDITVELVTSGSTDAILQGEAIQGFWQQNLGITVNHNPLQRPAFGDAIQHRDFQILFVGWDAPYDDPLQFLRIWRSGVNDAGWEEPAFDALLNQAQGADREDRLNRLAEAERLLLEHEEQPVAPVYWWAWAYLEHDYVQDVIRRPFGGIIEFKWAYTEGR